MERTPYDDVPYLSGAREAASPDRLGVVGRLAGLACADPARCKVLELACGDAGNLIPLAVALPESHFVGIDLAGSAIERGVANVHQLGLTNVDLIHGDLGSIGPAHGKFDYVIAHGVYSWVPAPVREQLLRMIRERMAPDGVAFVSYNAQPGSHVRHILREMMLRHTADFSDPATKVQQARALLSLLAMTEGDAADVYRPILQSEVGRVLQSSDWFMFHDDLAEVNDAYFFSDFIDEAARHGLQFAGEANFHDMSLDGLPEPVARMLSELGQRDRLLKEQYLDYVKCRGFRQTLLCHQEARLGRTVDTPFLRTFRFASRAVRSPDGEAAEIAEFAHPNRATLRTDFAPAIVAIDLLGQLFPASLQFPELAVRAGATTAEDEDALAEVLFRAFGAGVVEMRLVEPGAQFTVSDRPAGSPWARLRASTGRVVNLYHETIQLDDRGKTQLPLLDGTRTVPELASELGWDDNVTRETLLDLASHGLLIG